MGAVKGCGVLKAKQQHGLGKNHSVRDAVQGES